MICRPCQDPHAATECIDAQASREGLARHCYCQHRPRPARDAAAEVSAPAASVDRGESSVDSAKLRPEGAKP